METKNVKDFHKEIRNVLDTINEQERFEDEPEEEKPEEEKLSPKKRMTGTIIKKSPEKLEVEKAMKVGKVRRLARKKIAEQHNKNYVATSLDPKKYTWDKSHKKCLGRGYTGTNIITKEPIFCSCVSLVVEPEKKIT